MNDVLLWRVEFEFKLEILVDLTTEFDRSRIFLRSLLDVTPRSFRVLFESTAMSATFKIKACSNRGVY